MKTTSVSQSKMNTISSSRSSGVIGLLQLQTSCTETGQFGVKRHRRDAPVYFKDPNGLQLEFCSFTRSLNADDARLQDRAEISVRRLGLQDPDALRGGVPADGVMAETADRP